jgi:hypothetical protein
MDVRGVISKISRNKRRVLLDLFILCFVGAYFDCIFFIPYSIREFKDPFFSFSFFFFFVFGVCWLRWNAVLIKVGSRFAQLVLIELSNVLLVLFGFCLSWLYQNIESLHLYRDLICDCHYEVGYVYEKRSEIMFDPHPVRTYAFSIGVDEEHARVHRIPQDLAGAIEVGDSLVLRVSNDYPRLNCVKEWRVADNEILEKYEYELRSYKYRNEEEVWVEIENQ